MKKTNILYVLFIAWLLPACYEDLGNYDYREINELEVDSIRPLYNVDIDDSLRIYPILKGTIYSDTNRLPINGKSVHKRLALHTIWNCWST